MATTSLKLADDLKHRVADLANAEGISAHAFMVRAIQETATRAEQRAGFIADAMAARQDMLSSGKGYAATDVHTYLKARLTGKSAKRPESKPWRG